MNSSAVYTQDCVLNEQIARQVFDILPEDGPLVIIVSRTLRGGPLNYWPSDTERFTNLGLTDGFLKDLCAKLDDGDEPIITQVNDFSIVATALVTERTNCGYIIMALPQYTPESTLANLGLIEILLSQVGLIAHLIEQNNLLYEHNMNQFASCVHANSDTMLN
ncbi:MAG: hypothetical protein ABSH16_06560 [Sedimentisphaerales bacterium]